MRKADATPGTKVIATLHTDEWGDDQHVGPYVVEEYDDYTLVGVIRSKEARPGYVWVKWIEGELTDEEDQEVELKVLALESERSQMEKEFKETSKLIKEKMKEAAKLVVEAGKLADKAHAKSLESMYDVCRPLIDAMDDNGWRSSSWGC